MNANFVKNNNLLYHLIHALSPAEQRHLLIYLQKGQKSSTSVAVAIYKSLQKLKDFSETKYQKKLKKEVNNEELFFRLLERLPNEEVKLQDKIRRFLRDSSSVHYQHVQIKEMLTDVRLLMERGMAIQAQRLAEQIREKAQVVGDTLALLEINREERTIAHAIYSKASKEAMHIISGLMDERKRLLKQLEQEFDYQDVYDSTVLNEGVIKTGHYEHLPDILTSRVTELLGNDNTPADDLTMFAEMRKRQTKDLWEKLNPIGDNKIQQSESTMEWWHDRPVFLKDQLIRYFVSFNIFIHNAVFHNKNDEKQQRITEILRRVMYKMPVREYIEFKHINSQLFFMYLNTKKLDDAIQLIKKLETGLEKFVLEPAIKTINLYTIAVAYFVNGDFKGAAQRFHQLKKAEYKGVLPTVRYAVYLLELICLLEVSLMTSRDEPEEPLDLRYKWKKALELFGKWINDDSHLYIKALHYFHQVAFDNPTQEKKALEKWLEEVNTHKNDRLARGIQEQITWIGSRLNRLPIRKVFFTVK